MKKIIASFIVIMLVACQHQEPTSQIQTKNNTVQNQSFEFYNEYSQIFEDAIAICGEKEEYYFKNIEVIHIDRNNNRILVTLRNPENKRCSAFISFHELPQDIPQYVNIKVGAFVRETLPPILDGIKIEPYIP